MKTKLFTGKALLALLMSVSLLAISCDKDDDINDNTQTYVVSGNGSGSQVVPVVTTTATSAITGTYNAETNNLQYNISWTGLAATANAVQFFGPASTGANASGTAQYNLTITTAGLTGNASGNVTLTAEQEADLLTGKWYYIVGNTTYLTGEVRGQITATPQ